MQPYIFKELKTLVESGEITNTRSAGNQKLYQNYIDFVPTDQRDAILELQQSEKKTRYRIFSSGWTINCFNYDRLLTNLPNVKHCNIWIRSWNSPIEEIEAEISKWIKAIYGQELDFCQFMNQPSNRSIANKPHAHVFVDFSNFESKFITI